MELARFPLRRLFARLADGIDSTLLVLLLTLSMVGLAVLYSASYDVPGRIATQVVSLTVAITALWIVAAQFRPGRRRRCDSEMATS